MKYKVYTNACDLAEGLGLPREYGIISQLKAELTVKIIETVKKQKVTHQEIADKSGIPRSAVTGIINCSLQSVSLDRLIRLLGSLGKDIQLKVKNAA